MPQRKDIDVDSGLAILRAVVRALEKYVDICEDLLR